MNIKIDYLKDLEIEGTVDRNGLSLFIEAEDMRNICKTELDDLLSLYILGASTLKTTVDSKNIVSNELFLALRLWLIYSKGRFIIFTRIIDDIYNVDTKEPIRVIEIGFESYTDNKIYSMYYIEDICVYQHKESGVKVIYPEEFQCTYHLMAPTIKIEEESE